MRWSRLGGVESQSAELSAMGPKPERLMIDATQLKVSIGAGSQVPWPLVLPVGGRARLPVSGMQRARGRRSGFRQTFVKSTKDQSGPRQARRAIGRMRRKGLPMSQIYPELLIATEI